MVPIVRGASVPEANHPIAAVPIVDGLIVEFHGLAEDVGFGLLLLLLLLLRRGARRVAVEGGGSLGVEEEVWMGFWMMGLGIGGAGQVGVEAHHFGPLAEFQAEGEHAVTLEDGGVEVVCALEGLVDVAVEDGAADGWSA